MENQSQQAFLQAAKDELKKVHPDLTWDKFAELVGIPPLTFKGYRLPEDSSNYRTMDKFKRKSVEDLLKRTRKKSPKATPAA